ncbi:MAG: hypothetical protein LBL08_02620 [Candidatus Nomurabacteria bacterium]|jgi:hypothetical protein|nr:hypothetical protein [Candidatus Nomurabacteria bacterium]
MNVKAEWLVEGIVGAIRGEANKIPDFEYGAIAIRLIAKDYAANKLLGGIFVELDADRDHLFGIKPGAPKTRPAGWRGRKEEAACGGYVYLKLEGCARAVILGYGRRSSDLPDELVTIGRVNTPGAACYDIQKHKLHGQIRIYLGVSGADPLEDEKCVMAGGEYIEKWCEANGFTSIAP